MCITIAQMYDYYFYQQSFLAFFSRYLITGVSARTAPVTPAYKNANPNPDCY